MTGYHLNNLRDSAGFAIYNIQNNINISYLDISCNSFHIKNYFFFSVSKYFVPIHISCCVNKNCDIISKYIIC